METFWYFLFCSSLSVLVQYLKRLKITSGLQPACSLKTKPVVAGWGWGYILGRKLNTQNIWCGAGGGVKAPAAGNHLSLVVEKSSFRGAQGQLSSPCQGLTERLHFRRCANGGSIRRDHKT